MKIVGITCDRSESAGMQTRQYLNEPYIQAVRSAGALPLLIPSIAPEDAARYLDLIDGLLLTGGGDVDPRCYGAYPHPALGEIDATRDQFELALVKAAWERRLPMMAICRGIQVLNVALGGTLYQDLPSEKPSGISHRQQEARPETTHGMHIEPGSRLYSLVGAEMRVNSFHHQALDTVAPELVVSAYAPDGVIEAVESRSRPNVLAVQCHPEETQIHDQNAQKLFREFVSWL